MVNTIDLKLNAHDEIFRKNGMVQGHGDEGDRDTISEDILARGRLGGRNK